jgi:hypothetical protein
MIDVHASGIEIIAKDPENAAKKEVIKKSQRIVPNVVDRENQAVEIVQGIEAEIVQIGRKGADQEIHEEVVLMKGHIVEIIVLRHLLL